MGLFARAYGRFEARIKLPVGQGIWPAFWMLGNDFPGVSWPGCGEIDIMEYRGQEPRVLVGSVHGPGYSGNGALTRTHTLAQGGFHLDYHIFAIDWEPESVPWSVDGYVYRRITPADLPAGTRWVFDHPFFILLNVAEGGRWVGSPDASTVSKTKGPPPRREPLSSSRPPQRPARLRSPGAGRSGSPTRCPSPGPRDTPG